MTYVLTPGVDAPDMIHLDPSPETRCGLTRQVPMEDEAGNLSTVTVEVQAQEIDEATAKAMLDSDQAIPCRRCGLTRLEGYEPIDPHERVIEGEAG